MTIGSKIAQYRKKKGMTQDALAQLLGVTNQAVSKWESDQSCPDVMLLPQIADVFEIAIDELFDRAPQPKEQTVNGLPWEDDNVLRAVVYVGHRLVGRERVRRGLVISFGSGVDGVESDVTVQCGDVSGDVDASGSVTCGNVCGDVDAGTDVECGNVDGGVDAGCNVTCGNVGGNVDAGTDVSCGDVGGDIDAGCNVTCGNVGGNVDAGTDVSCGDVGGDIDAGCGVTVRK